LQPATLETCFALLTESAVDAVAVDEFRSLAKLAEIGQLDAVTMLDRPLDITALHAVIPKSHWRGTTFLYRLNAGLADLRASGRYDQIVARHLGLFWTRIDSSPRP
jgi:Bacterial extracellular solute-binding proteins, family 3.